MGIFDAFKKKQCDICGDDIGLLGNRKLEDGNMCKECAKKLSPWFDDRRHSTVAQIEEQLAYREANREKVAAFRTTRSFGVNTKLLIDEDTGTFTVTSTRDLIKANPDVLALADVTGCSIDIDEDVCEQKYRDNDGDEVSYIPPRYTCYYDFYVDIQVRNPYFDNMRFKLNGSRIEIEDRGDPRMPPPSPRPGADPRRPMGYGSPRIDPETDADYRRFREMGEEIRDTLLNARLQSRNEAAAAAVPKAAVVCPYCGATTTPDPSDRCEYCGGVVGA